MGFLFYGQCGRSIDIPDRELAHLQFVIIDKLRRGESFALNCHDPAPSRHVFWLSAAVPLEFEYTAEAAPALNRRWLEVLIESASHPLGLRLLPEPADNREPVLQRS